MWVFKANERNYHVGYYFFAWTEQTSTYWKFYYAHTCETHSEAIRMVNYLNGGNGFPFDLKPQSVYNEPQRREVVADLYPDSDLHKEIKRLKEELEFCRGASAQFLSATKYGI